MTRQEVNVISIFAEAFWLKIFKLNKMINTTSWYVLGLFWSEVVLFYIFRICPKEKRNQLIDVIGTLSLIFYVICFRLNGSFDIWSENHLVILSDGFVRGLSGVAAGTYLWKINNNTKKGRQNKNMILSIAVFSFLIAIIVAWLFDKRADGVVLVLIAIGIKFSFDPRAAT